MSACFKWKLYWCGLRFTFRPRVTTFNSTMTNNPLGQATKQSGMPRFTLVSILVRWHLVKLLRNLS
jgi:hypothetical protein